MSQLGLWKVYPGSNHHSENEGVKTKQVGTLQLGKEE